MNKSLIVGLIAGAGAATAVGAVASLSRDRAAPPAAVAAAPGAESFRDEDRRGELTRESLPAPVAAPLPVADAQPLAAAPAPAAPVLQPAVATTAPAPRPAARPAPRAESARVVDVRPVTRSVAEPREVCRDVAVERQVPVRDENRIAGTVTGAVIGGVIGNQIGDGRGRTAARIAGAVAGGYAGNQVQERVQKNNTEMVTERRCETVYDQRDQHLGYDVTYTFEGRTQTVRMDDRPGSTLPVRNGRVVTG